ncbi:MAG: hypothetical protein RBU30_09355 [Polyangia bacterium]|nr:hypothetical protein [Polyangia bacterium]
MALSIHLLDPLLNPLLDRSGCPKPPGSQDAAFPLPELPLQYSSMSSGTSGEACVDCALSFLARPVPCDGGPASPVICRAVSIQ